MAISLQTKTSAGGSTAAPSFLFDVAAELPLTKEEAAKTLFISDVNLDLGSFVTNMAHPVISQIDSYLNPLYPVVDALYADTYIFGKVGLTGTLDQNGDGRVAVMDLIQWFTNISSSGGLKRSRQQQLAKASAFLDDIKSLMDLVREFETIGAQGNAYQIPYGDYEYTFSKEEKLKAAASNENSVSEKQQAIQQKQNSKNKYAQILDKMKKIGITVPLIDNPSSIANLLTGDTTDILKWTVSDSTPPDPNTPSFNVESNVDLSFPMGPIDGVIKGDFNAKADLSFGLDTRGLNNGKMMTLNLEILESIFTWFLCRRST